MSVPQLLRPSLRRRPLAWAAGALSVSFGLFLGYFLWYALFEATPRLHELTWELQEDAVEGPPGSAALRESADGSGGEVEARWITHPQTPLLGYFRKTVHVPARIQTAWIQIAAPFTFDLYVNGRHVGADLYKSANVAVLYDITRYMQGGKNVIAIYNMSRTYEQHAEVLVLGAAVDWQGKNHPFASDGDWRTSDRYDRQIHRPGRPEWFDIAFDDTHWPQAVVERPAVRADRTREDFHPWTFRSPVSNGWIWAPDGTSTEAWFRREFRVSGRPGDAWLRLAAKVSYTLIVNGTALMEQEKGIVQEPGVLNLDIYEISPYLRPGTNVIAVKVHNRYTDRGLLVDGFASDRRGVTDLSTSRGDWLVASVHEPGWERAGFRSREPDRFTRAMPLVTQTPAAQSAFFKRLLVIDPPRGYVWREWMKRALLMALVAAAVHAQVIFAGRALAALGGPSGDAGRFAASLAAAPAALVLAFLWLVGYDWRFDPAWPFRLRFVLLGEAVFLGGLVLLLLRTGGFLGRPRLPESTVRAWARIPRRAARGAETAAGFLRRRWAPVLVALLMVVGYSIRIRYLDFEPIGADEIKMLAKSEGILRLGYPHVVISENIPTRWTTTSELVHYPMALAILIFGPTEFAVRLPGVLFSVATIALLYLYGRYLLGTRAGVLAAVVYTFLPSVIRMSQMARYPSQLQFFTLLTVFCFHRWLLQEPRGYRYLYGATAAYVATYLSWEGAGFLIPALFVGLLCVRREDLGAWLRDWRLVLCLFVITLVVALQLNNRMRVSGGLSIYGTGTSEISMMPMWNHSNFDAWYYWNNYLRIENHQLLTYVAMAGLLFCFGKSRFSRSLLYVNAVNVTVVFMETSFLQIRNWRYIYYLIPLLVLSASVSLFLWLDLAGRLLLPGRRPAAEPGALAAVERHAGFLRRAAATAAVAILAVSSTTYVLALYELPGVHGLPRTRLEDRYYPTVADAMAFLSARIGQDDVIVSSVPHLVDYYLPGRKTDYFLETVLQFQIFLDDVRIAASEPVRGSDETQWVGLHRVSGTPAILSYDELRRLLSNHHRVWYVTSPLDEKLLDSRTYDFIRENFSVVYENIASTVYLAER